VPAASIRLIAFTAANRHPARGSSEGQGEK
jgi:hypothetical protein